ncbi:MAG: hypothetical protein IPK76_15185 [Lewinellaceae bacterium]|nr:hypothetical protein [Lewinellaceae bacterium]
MKNLLWCCLVAILCLSFEFLHAQQLQQAPANDPSVSWSTPAQAQVKVQNKLDVIEPGLAGLTPGTGPHTDLTRRILFFKSILRDVRDEMPVPEAIEAALPEAASLGGLYEHTFTPEATLHDLYDEALVLLTN